MSLLPHRLCVCSGTARIPASLRSSALCRLPVNRCERPGKRCGGLRGLRKRLGLVRVGNDLSYVDDGAVEVPTEGEEVEAAGEEAVEKVEEEKGEEKEKEEESEEVIESVVEELEGESDEMGKSPEVEADVEVAVGEVGIEEDETVVEVDADGDLVQPVKLEEEMEVEQVPVESPFYEGQVVIGRIKWAGPHGSKVLIEGSEYEGWCPSKQYPFRIIDDLDDQYESWINTGLIREFRVIMIPKDMQPRKGPLLSARSLDRALAYRRVEQIMEVCDEDREVILTKCYDINSGGIRCLTGGMSSFLPRSHCYKSSRKFVLDEELTEKYTGKEVPVAVIGIEEDRSRVVVSEKRAAESNVMRNIRPGALVWGTVRTMREWGVFVAIDHSRLSCLLHISNISQVNVRAIEDVFQMGDRVCAVVISMEENFQRISISTADLEETAGDMLVDKEKVYEHAPQAVAEIQKEIDAQQALYTAEE